MNRIKETIVVEGRDDETAVLAAVEANIICTHGYGISQATIDEIKSANENCVNGDSELHKSQNGLRFHVTPCTNI